MTSRIALLCAVAAFAGCARTTAAPTAGASKVAAADYYPLAIGNEWTYVALGPGTEKKITILKEEDGFFVDSERSRLRHDAFGIRDDKRYLLQEPIEKGKTWSSIVSVSSTERYEIIDVGFTTSTPAGTFQDCVKVRGLNRINPKQEIQIDWVFAPNVGMLGFAMVLKEAKREIPQVIVELKSFKLAAKPAAAPPPRS